MADSLYEYLPKQHLLLGGLTDQYRRLYEFAIATAKENLFFRPLTPQDANILVSGTVLKNAADHVKLNPQGQHLTCFAGGMVAMGAKIFNRSQDLNVAQKLVDGCIWAYDSMPTGIMPELFSLIPCTKTDDCRWSDERWHEAVMDERGFARTFDVQRIIREDGLPPGFTAISDKRYLLRPEAIESIFILYRITGNTEYQDAAWRMFERIKDTAKTEFGFASIADVTCERVGKYDECEKLDSCESFWFGETLKYFYLIFAEPHLGSLDEFVYNTEAHPLRRPHPEKHLW
jgi:mannosyl-oligosaccharide alpha-1,2-mannosidase